MLTRNIATIEVKAGPEDGLMEGQFVAYASVFGNIDSTGDVVVKGAFKNTLAEWAASGKPIPLLFGHEMNDPDYNIGYVVDAAEDNTGLLVKCQLDLENPKAKQVYRLIKGRRIDQMSFAFDVISKVEKYYEGDVEVCEILEVKLYEVSVVTIGANQETEILAVKRAGEFAERVTAEVKAGRVLSAKNENELRNAYLAIGRVLTVLDGTTDEQKASEPSASCQANDDIETKSGQDEAAMSEESPREASTASSVNYSAITDAMFGQVLAEIA
jgi:HK97 family phage prohead protease